MKLKVIMMVLLGILIFGYSLTGAAVSYLGALAGGFLGEQLAAPAVVLLAKAGIIDEEEVFSPFSTVMYDAVDEGIVIGSVIGEEVVKYAFFDDFDPIKAAIDFSVSYILCELVRSMLGYSDLKVMPVVAGLWGGVIW